MPCPTNAVTTYPATFKSRHKCSPALCEETCLVIRAMTMDAFQDNHVSINRAMTMVKIACHANAKVRSRITVCFLLHSVDH